MNMGNLRPIGDPSRLSALPGNWALFETVAPPSGSYPNEGDNPTVYYARRLRNPSFPKTVGQQTLSFSYTDRYEYIFNLETEKYIEVGSVVLCFYENKQWYTIDKVVQDEPCCFKEMRRVAPLRLTITHRIGAGGSRVVVDSFTCTMRWHRPIPEFLTVLRDLPDVNGLCPLIGLDIFGDRGVWLSDEEKVWSAATRSRFPFGGADEDVPVRAFIQQIFGWTEQQEACESNPGGGAGQDYRLSEEIAAQESGACGFGMVRTDTHYDNSFITSTQSSSNPTLDIFDEFVYRSFASKVNSWQEFTCDPVYGFGFYPKYIGVTSQNGVIGAVDAGTGNFVEDAREFFEYLLTEI